MLLLPFLAILMIARYGHVSGEETFPILMLDDFGTKILSPVGRFCQKLAEDQRQSPVISILCGSVHELGRQFMAFGKSIMDQMNIPVLGTSVGHSNETRLGKPKVKPGLMDHYREFLTDVGEQIVYTMTGLMHLYIAAKWIKEEEKIRDLNAKLDKEILEIHKNADENKKLKSLKHLLITKINTLKSQPTLDIHECLYGILHVATEVYKNRVSDDAEKQLAFLLDFFVANMKYIEVIRRDDLNFSYKWKMRMTIEP